LGLLNPELIAGPDYFGHTAFADGDMVTTIQDMFDVNDDSERQQLQAQLRKVALALSAEAGLPRQVAQDQEQANEIAEGRTLLTGDLGCTGCHRFHDEGELGSAPDLTGYGSREWLMGMISNPSHERFYGDGRNDRMPEFAADNVQTRKNLLSLAEVGHLADWLRQDWFELETDSQGKTGKRLHSDPD
jgi:ubiquinol-cytochrome c reductase cytochrome b subunit